MTKSLPNTGIRSMLAYIQEDADRAETAEEISNILHVIEEMLHNHFGPVNIDTVQGLPNLRAALSRGNRCNVSTCVPESLVETFYDLSDRMNRLQQDDPETFQNASNALHWLATNDQMFN